MNYRRSVKWSSITVILAVILFIQSNYGLINLLILLITLSLQIWTLMFYKDYKLALKWMKCDHEIYIASKMSGINKIWCKNLLFKKSNHTLIGIENNENLIIDLDDAQWGVLELDGSISVVVERLKYNIKKIVK